MNGLPKIFDVSPDDEIIRGPSILGDDWLSAMPNLPLPAWIVRRIGELCAGPAPGASRRQHSCCALATPPADYLVPPDACNDNRMP